MIRWNFKEMDDNCQKEIAIELYKILDQYANEEDIKFFAKVFCSECLIRKQCIEMKSMTFEGSLIKIG